MQRLQRRCWAHWDLVSAPGRVPGATGQVCCRMHTAFVFNTEKQLLCKQLLPTPYACGETSFGSRLHPLSSNFDVMFSKWT